MRVHGFFGALGFSDVGLYKVFRVRAESVELKPVLLTLGRTVASKAKCPKCPEHPGKLRA